MGFLKVFGKSLGKALKKTGVSIAGVAVVAAGAAVSNPEIIAPVLAATGPLAPIVAIGFSLAGQSLLDVFKHRDKI